MVERMIGGSRGSRVSAALLMMLAGFAGLISTSVGAAAAPSLVAMSRPHEVGPPPEIQTVSFSTPGLHVYHLPGSYAVTLALSAQGGSGAGGNGVNGGGGRAGTVVVPPLTPVPGATIDVFVGAAGGSGANTGACAGGGGGSGNEVGQAGGQGGQCSYVRDVASGTYYAIAGGGGAGGGQGGGGGGGGGGGTGGYRFDSSNVDSAVGASGGSAGGGGGGGGTRATSPQSGAGGSSAATASDTGGGGGGGGGAGGGGGGATGFEGGGGGGGGASYSGQAGVVFGTATGMGTGTVTLYVTQGDGIEPVAGSPTTWPVSGGLATLFNVPTDAVEMTVLLQGTMGSLPSGAGGGVGGYVLEQVPITPGGLIQPGAAIVLTTSACAGGAGGAGVNGFFSNGNDGAPGGSCAAAYVDNPSQPNGLLAVAAGGGGGGGGSSFGSGNGGGNAGQSASGDGAGATAAGCGGIIGPGGNGTAAPSEGGGGGGGGGGGCWVGAGGVGGATTAASGGGGGGGGQFAAQGSGIVSLAGESSIYAYSGIMPAAQIYFTFGQGPQFTSAASAIFEAGQSNSVTVGDLQGVGGADPLPTVSVAGALPAGVTLTDNGDGTATLAGSPASTADGVSHVTLSLSSPLGVVTQAFTLTVESPPVITSASSAAFTVAQPSSFSVTATGFPLAALSLTPVSPTIGLPSGLTFVDNGNGTATIAGTPDAGSDGTYDFTVTASATKLADSSTRSVTQDLTLSVTGLAPQAITFTSSTASTSTGGTYQVTATGGASGNAVTFSIESASASVCTISAGLVTFNATGSCAIDADQVGNSIYAAAATVTQTVEVGKGVPVITLLTPLPTRSYPNTDFTLAAISGAGAVLNHFGLSYTLDPSSTYPDCRLQGANFYGDGDPLSFGSHWATSDVVQFWQSTSTDHGTCVVDINSPSFSTTFAQGPPLQVTFTIKNSQVMVVSSLPSIAGVGESAGFSAIASGNTLTSTYPTVFSVDASSTPGACTVTPLTLLYAQVQFTGVGTCLLDETNAGDATYWPTSAQESISVRAAQGIAFSPPASAGSGDSITLSATGGASGQPVTFSVDPSSGAGACSTSGTNGVDLSLATPGNCVVDANQAGDATYAAAPQVQATIVVNDLVQVVNFTTPVPGDATVAGATYTVGANASAGGAVGFSSATPATCAVSGSVVSFVAPGTCQVVATASAVGYYLAAVATQSFEVSPEAQAIVFTTSPSTPTALGSYVVGASDLNGAPILFTTPSVTVCAVTGTLVTFTGTGLCLIVASVSAAGVYGSAVSSQSVYVAPAPASIYFLTTPPSPLSVGHPDYTVAAVASSGAAVSFSSLSPGVCTVSGSTVHVIGAGECDVHAYAPAAGVYDPVAADQYATVGLAPQSITFSSEVPTHLVVGAAFTVSATGGGSGNPVTFSVETPHACSVTGGTVHVVGVGTCVIDAQQAGSSSFSPAPTATLRVRVARVVRVAVRSTRLVERNGTIAILLQCVGGPCRGSVAVSAGPVSLGSAGFSFTGPGSRWVGIDLSRTGRSDVLRAALPLALRLNVKVAGGAATIAIAALVARL